MKPRTEYVVVVEAKQASKRIGIVIMDGEICYIPLELNISLRF